MLLTRDLSGENTAVLYDSCVVRRCNRIPVRGGLIGPRETHRWFAQDVVPVCHCGIVTSAQDYARSVEKLTVRPLSRRLQSCVRRLTGKQRLPVKLRRRNWRPDESSADRTSGTSFERSVRSAGTIDLDRDALASEAA